MYDKMLKQLNKQKKLKINNFFFYLHMNNIILILILILIFYKLFYRALINFKIVKNFL